MAKQPEENTNATSDDLRNVQERLYPGARDPQHDEIADLARQLWLERGAIGGSPEEDWRRAEEILRDRYSGNASNQPESYQTYTGISRTNAEQKEIMQMDNYTSGTMENTSGTDYGQMTNDMRNRATDMANSLRHESEHYARNSETQPRQEHREGRVARMIEQQTAKLPSDTFLWAALGSIGLSLALELSGKERTATFVGHWAPTFLLLGLYNKLVKLEGSDGA
jgi:hypothetical protein